MFDYLGTQMLGGKQKGICNQTAGDCNQRKPIIVVYWTASYWLEIREMSNECYLLCVVLQVLIYSRQIHKDKS